MASYVKQHYIPKTYLRQFATDSYKNFVYCIDLMDDYRKFPRKLGMNDTVFIEKNFYTDKRLEDPISIENVLGTQIEPQYNSIIEAIEKRDFQKDFCEKLITWLMFSKMRSPVYRHMSREHHEFLSDWFYRMNKITVTEEQKIIDKKYIESISKNGHLDMFADTESAKEHFKLFQETLYNKTWGFLTPPDGVEFWTNDNPGFSVNTNPMFAKDKPFHPIIELNNHSIIYYELTPKFCLELTPPTTPNKKSATGYYLDFVLGQATPEKYNLIMQGVVNTRYKLYISNTKESLERIVWVPNIN
ncbi:MAG: DUF4238 domain-containing protein [Bacteroidota bacterium]